MSCTWDEAAELSDDALVRAIIEAAAGDTRRRDVLFEVLRTRFEALPYTAARRAGLATTLDEEFVAWFWRVERLLPALAAYGRGARRRSVAAYLLANARWALRDYLRHRRRHPALFPLAREVPVEVPPGAVPRAVLLDAVRTSIDRLRPTVRLPFKLFHAAALDFTDEDWAHLTLASGASRDEVEAAVRALRSAPPRRRLAAVGVLVGKKVHTVGTYVRRARDAVKQEVLAGM
jgi:DNA-directed RNA polymerase specialized sigma24 family protein